MSSEQVITFEEYCREQQRLQLIYHRCEFGTPEEHQALKAMYAFQWRYPEFAARQTQEAQRKKEVTKPVVMPDQARFNKAQIEMQIASARFRSGADVTREALKQARSLGLNFERMLELERIYLELGGFT